MEEGWQQSLCNCAGWITSARQSPAASILQSDAKRGPARTNCSPPAPISAALHAHLFWRQTLVKKAVVWGGGCEGDRPRGRWSPDACYGLRGQHEAPSSPISPDSLEKPRGCFKEDEIRSV